MSKREYVTKKELANTKLYVESMISKVRESLKAEGFTFSHYLVGSAGRNLATKTKEGFDLDYVFIFEKTDNKNKKIKPNIKQIVLQKIEAAKSENSKVHDSTSSIHYFTKNSDGNIVIESDICILLKKKDSVTHITGKGGSYNEIQLRDYDKIFEKFDVIKSENFNKFKEVYLKEVSEKNEEISSFETFIKVVKNYK